MNFINRFQIRSRLLLLLMVFGSVLAALGLQSWLQLSREAAQADETLKRNVSVLHHLGDLRAAVGNARRYEKDLFLNMGDEAATERYRKHWANEVENILALVHICRQELPSAARELDSLQQGIANYRSGVQGLGKRMDRGELNDPWAANKAMEPLKGDIRAADEAVAAIGREVKENANLAHEETLARAQNAQATIVAATLLAWAIGTGLTWLTARSITAPLRELQKITVAWERGDLSVQLQDAGRDEIAVVRQGLEAMRKSLVQLMCQSRQVAGLIYSASQEISSGNQDLSNRTEQAANHLQQTSSAMAQLTVTVEQTASSSREADGLATTAANNAAQGGRAMEDAVQTMNDIATDSRRIADIVSVIDSIAFQTNILALNAAVEAARAGEQGRGFAVVASEVRALAQRSGDAAREIKTLINGSVAKVDSGASMIAHAGTAVRQIVEHVHQVSQAIQQITTAAVEQSSELRQVNETINELDRSAQQNAAMVEENAAATAQLTDQARQLEVSLAQFKFD